MVKHIRGQDYAEYLKGNSWRCSNSSTGAHYWIVGNQMSSISRASEFREENKWRR